MGLEQIDPDLAEVISRARRAWEQNLAREQQRPPRPKLGVDLSSASPEDKRSLYLSARDGKLGHAWKEHARRVPIGIWLLDYEWYRTPPAPR